jgi:tetratricopeptide (TPR) repeat protein
MSIKNFKENFLKYLQLLYNSNDFVGVISECSIFLQKNKGSPLIFNFLGLAQYSLKKYKESVISFKQAIDLDKNNHLFFQNLFFSYLNLNLKFSAVKVGLKIVKLNNQIIEVYLQIYKLLYSIKSKKKILEKISNNLDVQKTKLPNYFFSFLINNREYEAGIEICKLLLKYKKNYILLNILGQFYLLNEQIDLAKQSQIESLNLKSDYFCSYYDLGKILQIEGNFSEAKKNYEQAIRYNTKKIQGELHRALSSVKKYQSLDDEHIVQMNQLILSNAIDEKDKCYIKFGLAKAYEDLKEYELSFKYFEEANTNYYKLINYSDKFFKMEVNIFKNFYLDGKIKLKDSTKIGFKEINPIFIIGLPRSGSTLVEQIISSHSEVKSYGESKAFGQSLSTFFNVFDLKIFQEQLSKVSDDFYNKIGREYVLRINKNNSTKYFTDKMLFNFCYLGLIKLCLPNAKIILCQRDYRDIFVSIYKNFFFEVKMGFSFDKNEILNFIIFYHQSIKYWESELGDFIFIINYEKLINNPSQEVHHILDFCSLKWEEQCLKFYQNKSEVKTVSNVQVRQNFYTSSQNLWKKYEKFFSHEFKLLDSLMSETV